MKLNTKKYSITETVWVSFLGERGTIYPSSSTTPEKRTGKQTENHTENVCFEKNKSKI